MAKQTRNTVRKGPARRRSDNGARLANGKAVTDKILARWETAVADARVQIRKLEDEVGSQVKRALKEGERARKEATARLSKLSREIEKSPLIKSLLRSDLASKVREFDPSAAAETLRSEATTVARRGWDVVSSTLELPNREDLEAISQRIDQLGKQLQKLERTGRTATARRGRSARG